MIKSVWCVLFVLALILAGCDAAETEDDRVEVTVLMVFQPAVSRQAGDVQAYLQNALAETNQTYINSNINLTLKLVHAAEVEYELSERLLDLERLLLPADGYLDQVHSLRDTYEADIVVFVSDNRASTVNASIMAEEATAFVIVHWESLGEPEYGLAHEIGHLFGARHTPDSDAAVLPFAFGHGFRNDSLRTIMANGQQLRVPYYAGPDQRYEGDVLGDSTSQNVAEVLRTTAVYISNFRGEQTESDFEPSGTWPTISLP